jgi:hypothetical protein
MPRLVCFRFFFVVSIISGLKRRIYVKSISINHHWMMMSVNSINIFIDWIPLQIQSSYFASVPVRFFPAKMVRGRQGCDAKNTRGGKQIYSQSNQPRHDECIIIFADPPSIVSMMSWRLCTSTHHISMYDWSNPEGINMILNPFLGNAYLRSDM